MNLSSIYGLISPKFEIYENTKMTVAVEYSMIKSALIHFTKYTAKFLKIRTLELIVFRLVEFLIIKTNFFLKIII